MKFTKDDTLKTHNEQVYDNCPALQEWERKRFKIIEQGAAGQAVAAMGNAGSGIQSRMGGLQQGAAPAQQGGQQAKPGQAAVAFQKRVEGVLGIMQKNPNDPQLVQQLQSLQAELAAFQKELQAAGQQSQQQPQAQTQQPQQPNPAQAQAQPQR